MKKIIIILSIISFIYIFKNKDEVIIPSDSIRFRIIANSNSIEDQNIKNTIKDDLINNVFQNIINIENSIDLVDNTLKKYDVNYSISFGNNYFPKKTYKGITYPSGNYKSLVITLESGMGNNFWCVMYPPLCLIDNMKDTSDITYKFLIMDTLKKYQEM